MLAVGFGTSSHDVEFVILQNQWGEDWGESGFVRVEITDFDECGILAQAFAILV